MRKAAWTAGPETIFGAAVPRRLVASILSREMGLPVKRTWSPTIRRTFAGLLAVALVSLSVQHALYLCAGMGYDGARPEPSSSGCHDEATPGSERAGQDSGVPSCCSTQAALVSLPSAKEVAAISRVLVLGAALPASSALHGLARAASAIEGERGRKRPRTPFQRLRPHLALRTLLL